MPKEILFGEIAVQAKVLTHEQLVDCLMTQQRQPQREIGEIALEKGYITVEQLRQVLDHQKKNNEDHGRRLSQRFDTVPPRRHTRSAEPQASPSMEVLLADYVEDVVTPDQPHRRARASATPALPEPPSLNALLEVYVGDAPPAPAASPKPKAIGRTRPVSAQVEKAKPAPAPRPRPVEPAARRPAPQPAPPAAGARPAEPAPPTSGPAPTPVPKAPVKPAPVAAAKAAETTQSDAEPLLDVSDAQSLQHAKTEPALAEAGETTRPADTSAGLQMIERVLRQALERGASDIHIHSGAPLLARIAGDLTIFGDGAQVDDELAQQVIAALAGREGWDRFARSGEIDFAYALRSAGGAALRVRANAYRQQRGADIVFRLIPEAPPTLDSLNLPPELVKLADYRNGMVLCTGPAGCGKSTTLAALLYHLARDRADHVITVEDPIEFVYPGTRAVINQRQLGAHTASCARALRAALREDPDIIVISELRDAESISLAMSAAETGHLVLGTLPTGGASQTINRIVYAAPAEQQAQVRVMLAESLRAVVSQRLVQRKDGEGRLPALEVLINTTAIANLIRDDRTHQIPSTMQVGKAHGMRMLDDSLQQMVAAGQITADAARRVAHAPERIQ